MKIKLDPADLSVSAFETGAPATQRNLQAAMQSDDTLGEVCYCNSWLAEDCFGPTAGCSNSATE